MIQNRKKVLTVGQVVDRGRKSFRNRVKSIKIIRTFFSEVLKILITGKEVRFPGKSNGKLYLAVKEINLREGRRSQVILKNKKESFLKGVVKPVLHGFEINTVGRVGSDKKFTLRFAYHDRTVVKLQSYFFDNDIERRKLPEIQ